MKRIPSLIVRSLVTLLITGAALPGKVQAQSDVPITTTVSFPFIVGTETVAPGTYRFSLSSPFLLSIVNVKTGDMEMFMVRPEQQRTFELRGRLIFHHSEGYRVLNEVHFPGTQMFSEVIERRGGRRIVARGPSTSPATAATQR